MRRPKRGSFVVRIVWAAMLGMLINAAVALCCCLAKPGLTSGYGDPTVADLRAWAGSVPAGFPSTPDGTTPNWYGFGYYTAQMFSNATGNPNRSLYVLYLVRSGWPVLSFEGMLIQDGIHQPEHRGLIESRASRALRIPVKPILSGVIFNSVLYACLALVGRTLVRQLLRRRRTLAGQCRECGHQLLNNEICPECGAMTGRLTKPA